MTTDELGYHGYHQVREGSCSEMGGVSRRRYPEGEDSHRVESPARFYNKREAEEKSGRGGLCLETPTTGINMTKTVNPHTH